MNLIDAPLGLAFEGDYPESYGPDTSSLRTVVQRQVGGLTSPDAGADARLIGILTGRRSGDLTRSQVEVSIREDGGESLLARGELALATAAYRAGTVAHLLTSYDEVGQGDHVLLRRPQAVRSEVERIIAECSAEKVSASLNYLNTMAAIGKGIGGPENAPRLPDFGQYRIPGASEGGRRVRVAVIDTGVPQVTRGDHWLDGVPRTADNIDELDVLPAGPDGHFDYAAGHGTFVTGVIQRVAPTADITMYRAADTDGFASDFAVAAAILQAHRDGAEVINLSLGSQTVDDEPPPLMAEAVRTVQQESGGATVIVAAAGNYGNQNKVFPAALDGVEAVAGLTPDLEPAGWSSSGSAIRFSAVGEGIHSIFPEGVESPVFDPEPDTFGPNAAALWSGTSFAAPQITGAIARIVAELGSTPRAAVDLLDARGVEIDGYGKGMRILQGIG
jgi:subtilisin family serine protease